MTNTVTIHEAKTHLSRYIKQAKAGKTIYFGSYGQPEVKLVAITPQKKKLKLGIWAHKPLGYKDEDIVGSDPDIVKDFENSKVMPDGSF